MKKKLHIMVKLKRSLHLQPPMILFIIAFLLTTVTLHSQTFETETLAISGKSSDTHRTLSDSKCSASATAILDANAVGDFVTYSINIAQAGAYTVKLRLKNHPSRGKFQTAIAQPPNAAFTNLGSIQDAYSSSATYPQLTLGNITFETTGVKQFKFGITGKNSKSSGYTIAVDAIILLPVIPSGGEIGISVDELIFSGVKSTQSVPQQVNITNSGEGSLTVSMLTLAGTNANTFVFVNAPALPLTVNPGQSASVKVAFKPGTKVGALKGILRIVNDDSDESTVEVGLYGLSAKGEQGSNEPPLHQVAQTLGYNINVGGTGLILSTKPEPIGDEVIAPLFQKADSGPVTLKPVARYSPDDLLPFGYYTPASGSPVHHEVAVVAENYEQSLNPAIVSGGSQSFDPGNTTFGFYVGATSYAEQNTYTQDNLNTGPLKHSVRIYPLKNRTGVPIPNSYFICFEPARNGDYQDYVFVATNIKPAQNTTGNASGMREKSFDDTPVGTENETAEATTVSIYPTPANRMLHIKSNHNIELISIASMNGTIVMSQAYHQQRHTALEFNISDFTEGLYVIKLLSGRSCFSKKIYITK